MSYQMPIELPMKGSASANITQVGRQMFWKDTSKNNFIGHGFYAKDFYTTHLSEKVPVSLAIPRATKSEAC